MPDPNAGQMESSRLAYADKDTAELIQYYTVERDSFEPEALKAIAAEIAERGIGIKKFFCDQCDHVIYVTSQSEVGESAQCQECGAFNPVPESTYEIDEEQKTASRDSDSTEVLEPGEVIEILLPPAEKKDYRDMEKLREDILAGQLKKTLQARKYTVDAEGNRPQKMPPFATLEKAVSGVQNLHQLYKPVWAHTSKYALVGGIIGVGLKFLDTTVGIFFVSGKAGLSWLVLCLLLLVGSRIKLVLVVAIGAAVIFRVNIFTYLGAVFGVFMIGALFGAPFGAIIGAIVGYFRSRSLTLAPDYKPEGAKPYLLGLLVPAVILAIAVPIYLSVQYKLF
jgi:DNA-directed RNA polymerase subunit M/transcription elongation factor TFIIS